MLSTVNRWQTNSVQLKYNLTTTATSGKLKTGKYFPITCYSLNGYTFPSQWRSTLKEKNLLLYEPILSCKSRPHFGQVLSFREAYRKSQKFLCKNTGNTVTLKRKYEANGLFGILEKNGCYSEVAAVER